MSEFVCKHIDKKRKHFHLQDISFSLESGYLSVLAGVNGSGKTTLLDCICGADRRFSGTTCVDGISLKQTPTQYGNQIAYITERFSFFTEKTIFENGAIFGRFYKNWAAESFCSWLETLELPPGKPVYALSKGERMKLQVAFALSHHPRFLFLDEPLDGFDPVFRHRFLDIMQHLLDMDIGILISTHITEDLDRLADHVLILDNGKLTVCGSKEDLSDHYAALTGCRVPQIRDLLQTNLARNAQNSVSQKGGCQ